MRTIRWWQAGGLAAGLASCTLAAAAGNLCLESARGRVALPDGIRELEVRGNVQATLKAGTEAGANLNVPEGAYPYLQCSVSDRRLVVEWAEDAPRFAQPVQLDIRLLGLEHLIVRGRYAFMASGFSGKRVEVENRGSGKLDFSGNYDEADLTMRGSGQLLLQIPAAQLVRIVARGSGEVIARGSTERLVLRKRGSGNVSTLGLNARSVDVGTRGGSDLQMKASDTIAIDARGSGTVEVGGNPASRTVAHGKGGVHWR
jgi:hypothetical protein